MKKVIYLFTFVLVCALCACGGDEDEPTVKFSNKSLSYGETYSIPNGSKTEWLSSNDYIVSVSGSTIKAERVGEATISSKKGSFKVTVTPNTYVYTEPCLQWGCTKSTVKSYMNKISAVSIREDNSTTLNYFGSGKVQMYNYTFENSGLKGAGAALNGDYVDTNAMSNFMVERYIPVDVDESNYTFYLISPDEKTFVGMQLRASGRTIIYLITFVPVLTSGRSPFEKTEMFGVYGNTPSEIVKDAFEKIKASL